MDKCKKLRKEKCFDNVFEFLKTIGFPNAGDEVMSCLVQLKNEYDFVFFEDGRILCKPISTKEKRLRKKESKRRIKDQKELDAYNKKIQEGLIIKRKYKDIIINEQEKYQKANVGCLILDLLINEFYKNIGGCKLQHLPIFFILGGINETNKKLKLNKLNFYTVEESYIKYLNQFDKHIAYNKDEKRAYVGVVFVVNNHYYFAPLFSPKPQHKKYKNNSTIFKIKNVKTKTELGIIRFSDMIPVPIEYINLLDVNNKSYGYKRLITEQYYYINKPENRQKILKKAETIYNIVTSSGENKMTIFYKNLSCNYKLLEEKSSEYDNDVV